MNRDGARTKTEEFFARELPLFKRYCEGLEGTGEFVSGLERLQQSAGRQWNERSRKEMEILAYRAHHTKGESRMMARGMSVESLRRC